MAMMCSTALVLPPSRGSHSFMLELNLSTFGTHESVNLGYVAENTAQVELKRVRNLRPCRPARSR